MTTRLNDIGVSTTGNVTADGYFIGDGSLLTGIGGNVDFANVASNVIPSANITYSLGNATNQWKDLWVSNATIYLNSVPLSVGNTGALQFNGNDIVTSGPNVINTGNVETTGDVIGGNLVIATGGNLQFADGSIQTSAYGNANVAVYLPTYTGNVSANIISASGNVTGNYFIGDGSQLTGLPAGYANANAASFLADFGSNTISTTGNINAGTIVGSGNISGNSFVLNNAGNLTYSSIQRNQNPPYGSQAFGIEMLTTADDPSVFSSVSAGTDYVAMKSTNAGNANVIAQGGYGVTISTSNASGGSIKEWTFTAGGATLFPGSFSTAGNVYAPTMSLTGNILTGGLISTSGNIISGNFDTIGNLTSGGFYTSGDMSVAGNISVNGNIRSGSFIADYGLAVSGEVTATGNVFGAYFFGNGSQLTGLPVQYDNANVATFLADFGSNSIFTTGDISAGNVTLTDIYSPSYYGNGVTYANATGHLTNSNLFKYDPSTEVLTVGSVSTTGNITGGVFTANILVGEGGNISNITGANVVGAVALANIANVAYSVNGANVVGEVAVANTVSNPTQSNITALGTIVSLTANAINVNGQFTANGNAQFNQDVYFAGNVTIPGNINQISGNSGQFFGNAVTGFGALYAGLPAGYTLLNNEVVQFADNYDGYTQVTHQNINGGAQATGDFVITADNGTDFTNHIDMGMAGSGYDGLLANNSLGTSLYANDGYLYTRGNVTGGNLVLGANQANGVVRIIANGASNIGDVVATFGANGLTIGDIIAHSGSPAPSISGFSFSGLAANISGNVTGGNVLTSGIVSATGNITGNYIVGNGSALTSVDAITLQGAAPNTASSVNTIVQRDSGGRVSASGFNTAGTYLGEGNVYTESWLVANNMGVETYQLNVTGNASATGSVTMANLIIGAGGIYKEPGISTLIMTANIANNNTTVNVSDNGAIVIQAAEQLALGIGANTYIDITNAGIQVDSNITARANVGTYNLTGWDTINGNTISASGNINAANLVISQGGVYKDGNTFIFTANASNDINGVHLVDGGTTVVYAGGNSVIQANSSGTNSNWVFDTTGNLTLPGGAAVLSVDANSTIGLYSDGANSLNGLFVSTNSSTEILNQANVLITTDTGGNTYSWIFDNNGNLTLPTNNFNVNYSNGTPVTLGGNYSDSNVVTLLASYGSNTISTTGNVSTGNIITGSGTGGNITGVNIMSANVFIGDGGNLTNLPSSGLVVNSMTSGANITASVNDTQYNVTALAVSANVTAPTGVAQDGQKLTYRIIDNGTPQTLTWDPVYQVIGTTLPTTTVASKYVYVGVIYNSQDVTWDVVSVAQQA